VQRLPASRHRLRGPMLRLVCPLDLSLVAAFTMKSTPSTTNVHEAIAVRCSTCHFFTVRYEFHAATVGPDRLRANHEPQLHTTRLREPSFAHCELQDIELSMRSDVLVHIVFSRTARMRGQVDVSFTAKSPELIHMRRCERLPGIENSTRLL
jgi:hypothetical protein